MPLETFNFIDSLNASNPVGATDVKGQGDDHLRGIKLTLLNSFPNIAGPMSLTHTQLNNAAIKTEANVFTASQTVSSANPIIKLVETDATANNAKWYLGQVSTEALYIGRLVSDDELTASNPIIINRTLNVIDSIQLDAVDIRLKGGVVSLRSAGTTDTENRRIDLEHSDGTLRGYLGYNADDQLRVRNEINGGNLLLQARNAAGTILNAQIYDPDNAHQIYHQGSLSIATHADGIDVYDVSGGSTYIGFKDSSAIRAGFLQFSSTSCNLRNEVHGTEVRIQGEDTGGTNRNLVVGNPDGAVTLYYAGGDRLLTDVLGVIVRQDGDTDTADHRIRWQHNNATDRALAGFLSSDTFRIRNQVHGGPIALEAEDSAGNAQTLISCDPDDASIIYNGASNEIGLRTQTRTATGATSSGRVLDHGGTNRDVGFNVLPTFNLNTSDTLEASHAGADNRLTGANSATLTLEANTSTDFPVDAVTHLVCAGSGIYTVTEGTGVTLYYIEPGTGRVDTTGGCTVGPGGVATIKRISSTEYEIFGSEISYTP